MVSKPIYVKPDIYEALLKRKRKDETISDVIARLIGSRKEFSDYDQFFSRWKDLPQEYFEIMELDRKEIRAEINRRFD
jgi:predicted CopG family antitoxin